MGHRRLRILGILSWAAISTACSSNKLGNNVPPDGSVSPFALFSGAWTGYAEATAFSPDGTDKVALSVDLNGNGTLSIGSTAPLPPPTDPNLGYPPVSDPGDPSGLWEGFRYPIHEATATARRIQLGLDDNDIFADWCALQTPVAWSQIPGPDGGIGTFYSCVPNWSFGPSGLPDGGPDAGPGCALFPPDGGQPLLAACNKITACEARVCLCTAASCSSREIPAGTPLNHYPAELDATLDDTGTMLTGTLATPSGTHLNIHLTNR